MSPADFYVIDRELAALFAWASERGCSIYSITIRDRAHVVGFTMAPTLSVDDWARLTDEVA